MSGSGRACLISTPVDFWRICLCSETTGGERLYTNSHSVLAFILIIGYRSWLELCETATGGRASKQASFQFGENNRRGRLFHVSSSSLHASHFLGFRFRFSMWYEYESHLTAAFKALVFLVIPTPLA